MLLSNEQLKKYFHGAYSFGETEDGYLWAYQYSAEQMNYFRAVSPFWYDRCSASSVKTIELDTAATEIAFDYKIVWEGSKDTIEMAVGGLVTQIYRLKDIGTEGRLTFTLPEGDKHAVIYLPSDATAVIKNFSLNADAGVSAKGERVLWMGDSITQGYGTFRSAHTYVSAANRILNYDIINQGIGGYVYDKGSVMRMDGYTPDKIIIALGTNQYGAKSMADVEEFYERLAEIYGDTPALCVTPLWRGDSPDGLPTLIRFCDNIKEICGQYANIKIADGFSLVPHLPEYFIDNLHPNALGAEIYGCNLAREIAKLGF